MISMAKVKSASSAAEYYSRDNFYTAAEGQEHSAWSGRGAETLGLSGNVTRDALQAVLEGRLPDGSELSTKGAHAPGSELVFSPPKSVSLLALVGGDERIVAAHRQAVKTALAWAEQHLVQTRLQVAGSTVKVATDNLVVALIEHDTNRNLEPDLHTHALIANATQGPDGKWRTLVNEKIWKRNTLLASIYHAELRRRIAGLGYQTTPQGKHGMFEVNGVSRATIEAYSTRAQEIRNAWESLTHQTPKTKAAMALKTRHDKGPDVDRSTVAAAWQNQAANLGVDFKIMVESARKTASPHHSPWGELAQSLTRLGQRASAFLDHILSLVQGRSNDPLVPENPARMTPERLAAAHALASAIRHLSEREAAFSMADLTKAALDLHLPIGAEDVAKRIAELKAAGLLIAGSRRHPDLLTTPGALNVEQRILELAQGGLQASPPVLSIREAGRRVQAAATAVLGHPLNPGQEAAGRLILSSSDRYVRIQGVAGAGKTAMLEAVAEVLRENGYSVLGLGHQNKLVRLLARETGISAQTVRSFIAAHRAVLEGKLNDVDLAARRQALAGKFLMLDEASMISNDDKLRLMQIADKLQARRVVFVGDEKQIGAIEAGKPFELLGAARLPTQEMNQNVRQRTPELRAAAAAAREGRISTAMTALRPMMQEVGDPAAVAAATWLALPPHERERTAIYASGRTLRENLNTLVQEGLRTDRTLKGDGQDLTVLDRLGITREEERFSHIYKPGLRIEFARSLPSAGIRQGTWGTITSVDTIKGKITLTTDAGEVRSFNPQTLALNRTRETVRLYATKTLRLYEGDQIRWTENDKDRGLLNADLARVVHLGPEGVLIRTATDQEQLLPPGDPMLKRIDLAYALNAHMAQGLTSDQAIAVMLSHERNLSNQRLFLVTITRVRDQLAFITDSIEKLTRQIANTPGNKTSALETASKIQPIAPPALSAPPLSPSGPKRTPSLDLG